MLQIGSLVKIKVTFRSNFVAIAVQHHPMKDNRPKKNRPSNVVAYIFISLIGIVGLFLLGAFLESQDWGIFRQGAEGALPTSHTLQAQVADGN